MPMIRDMPTRRSAPQASRSPRPGAAATSARAHVAALRGIPVVLARFGVPSEPILATANLRPVDLNDPECTAPFAELDRLLGLCMRKTRCEHLGLLVGQHIMLQSFGVVGRAARNAPSVGAALQDLAAFFVLHDSGGSVRVAIRDGRVTLCYGIHVPGLKHSDQVYDLAVAALANVMRQLCGQDWRPDAVLLTRKRPADIRPYREFFAAPLRFDSIMAAVVFPERHLSQAIADADPLLHKLLSDNAAAAMARTDPILHTDVRRTIRLLLQTQQCSRNEVARRLGMHERTLGRRLQASGTTFQRLIDDTRRDIAQQLLRDTNATLTRIAAALGYRDPTIFTRAFARWTGRTPSRFRAENANAPAEEQ
jgi:AraC-like DNA-binding protein